MYLHNFTITIITSCKTTDIDEKSLDY